MIFREVKRIIFFEKKGNVIVRRGTRGVSGSAGKVLFIDVSGGYIAICFLISHGVIFFVYFSVCLSHFTVKKV